MQIPINTKMSYWHSVCPVCEQGRLFIAKILGTGRLFLLCEECEAAWLNPEIISIKSHFNFQGFRICYAEYEDIKYAGWIRYQLIQLLSTK